MEKDQIESLKKDLLRKYKTAQGTFGDADEEDQEILKRFSFICLLSFDVYVKKMMIEHLIDGMNDWFNAMMYIDSQNLIPLQYLLIKIESSIDWLASNKAMMGVNGLQIAQNMPKETIKMAIVVISTLPIIFAYPFFQRYFVNGLTIGAVKE